MSDIIVGSVGIILDKAGNVLLGKKRSDSTRPMAGQWMFIGGRAKDSKELSWECLKREVYEETRITVHGCHLLCWDDLPDIKVMYYVVDNWEGMLEANDDLVELKWVPMVNAWEEVGDWSKQEISPKVFEYLTNPRKAKFIGSFEWEV